MSASRHPLEAAAHAEQAGQAAALAVVLETEGSTYVGPGGMSLFGEEGEPIGWLSGGCLEPEVATRARQAIATGQLHWMEIDTRDDEDLLSGSALGCRGRLRLVLLPLRALPGWPPLVRAWRERQGPLHLQVAASGDLVLEVGALRRAWALPAGQTPWLREGARTITLPPPPTVAIFGAGPESATLLPLLRQLGWITHVIECRARWTPVAAAADHLLDATPEAAAPGITAERFDAVLVMHHHFERDRETLVALAGTDVAFIGLLGPRRRREDLLRVIPPAMHAGLLKRLRSPVGLKLGGRGPEAIALSIAAQLQAWRHGEAA